MPGEPTTRLIGVDEAGYGPNLGPLVVSATLWEVPAAPAGPAWDEAALWKAFEGIVSPVAARDEAIIQIADSKQVHSSSAGIGPLERSAHAVLGLAGQCRDSFGMLWDELHAANNRRQCREPWYREGDCQLPRRIEEHRLAPLIDRWKRRCADQGCRLIRTASDLVVAERFNQSVARSGSKGRLLSETTLRLLRELWDPNDARPAVICCDKHGGRDRYAPLLAEIFPEKMPVVLEESRTVSRYRLGGAEFRFQARSESQLPVAAASIIAKYLRELAMDLLNGYWLNEIPGLKPTRGYPLDARRFREAISPRARALGLEPDWYWRQR